MIYLSEWKCENHMLAKKNIERGMEFFFFLVEEYKNRFMVQNASVMVWSCILIHDFINDN